VRRAARRAAALGAPEQAERSFRTAIELATDGDERRALTRDAAEMAVQSRRYEAALALVDPVVAELEAAGRPRDAARLAGLTGRALRFLGHGREAIERMTAALAALDPTAVDPDVAGIAIELARALSFAGRLEEADRWLDVTLVTAQALADDELVCQALTVKAIRCMFADRGIEAGVLFDGAIAIADARGTRTWALWARLNSGDMFLRTDAPEADERLQAAVADARRLGQRGGESAVVAYLATLRLLQGRWEEVERLGGDLLARRDGEAVEEIHSRLALLCCLRGQPAEQHLAALAPWERHEDLQSRLVYATTRASVELASGRPEAALAHAGATVRDAIGGLGVSHDITRQAWPDALDAAVALRRADDIAALVELLAERPAGHVPPFLRAQLHRGRGLLAAAGGDDATARTELAAAVEGFAALGYPYWLARARAELAERGPADPAALLSEAIAAFAALGAAPALARARQAEADLPRSAAGGV